jgi:hypothetical protein
MLLVRKNKLSSKCQNKKSDVGLDFETWVGLDDEPECKVSINSNSKHTVLVRNYKPISVNVYINVISKNGYLTFKGTTDTYWSDTVTLPPRKGSQPRVNRRSVLIQPNLNRPANQETIKTDISHIDVIQGTRKIRISSMYLEVDIR